MTKKISLLVSVIILSFAAAYFIFAWEEPGTLPPGDNVPTPINVGTDPQAKAASIAATEFYDYNNPDYYINPFGQSVFSGKIGIGTKTPGAKLDIRGQIIGGFGAQTTGGTKDWNDISNVRSGSGYTLLLGNAANGPGPGTYFHPFNFEYNSKSGSGNITQFAIPYGATSHMNSGFYMRGRYSGTWSPWMRILSENSSGNVGIGTTAPAEKLDVQGGVKIGHFKFKEISSTQLGLYDSGGELILILD